MKFCVSRMKTFLCRVVATGFFVGHIPYVPGTAASLVTAGVVFFIPAWHSMMGHFLYGALILFLLIIGVGCSGYLERLFNEIDPSYVVIDEVVGMLIALFCVPQSGWWYMVAFGLFRFFDISKIFPICVIEKRIKGGWGMMLDDVAAGIFSLVIIHMIMLIFTC